MKTRKPMHPLLTIAICLLPIFLLSLFADDIIRFSDDREFYRNREDILVIKDYLINSENSGIRISLRRQSWEVWSPRDGVIEDKRVVDAIDRLGERGFGIITSNSDVVRFQRWTRMASGRGFVYSIDGQAPYLHTNDRMTPGMEFLTQIRPLSVPGWFYYEEDFNTWRRLYGTGSD